MDDGRPHIRLACILMKSSMPISIFTTSPCRICPELHSRGYCGMNRVRFANFGFHASSRPILYGTRMKSRPLLSQENRPRIALTSEPRYSPVTPSIAYSEMATMGGDNKIIRFQDAMCRVYGPLDLAPEQAKTWTAPASPGAGGHRGRYLWTDAFGVVNLLTLHKETSNPTYLELAKSLVRTVHDVLSYTRDGRSRLPGATDDAPLAGGLRIGKMDEGGSDGDGQYHHYLTLWMFALNRLSVAAGEKGYNDLAVQLAVAIHPHFVHRSMSRGLKLVWKVSMDLKSVLVGSEGHLDGATGYVVYTLLRRTATHFDSSSTILDKELKDYQEIINRDDKRGLAPSSDTLDLGMGLWMCHIARDEPWAQTLGAESLVVARRVADPQLGVTARPAWRRLAFREFGFCLGVGCYGAEGEVADRARELMEFWRGYAEGEGETGDDLRPISLVMYAAALKPGGELPLHYPVALCLRVPCLLGRG